MLNRLKNHEDHAGWQEFFDAYWKLIYGVAIKAGLTDAEAQDAVQDTIIEVSKHIGEFKYDPSKCSFKTWLLLLTRQRISRQFARRARNQSLLTSAATSEEGTQTATIERVPDPAAPALDTMWDEEWEKHLLAMATERVKQQVKPEQFQVFDLYVLQQWPVAEVARVLGVSTGQVYLTKHRVSALLKRAVKQLERGL